MARKFSRRRPAVVWLPTYGTDFTDGQGAQANVNGINGIMALNTGGFLSNSITPCTFDYTDSASAEDNVQERSLQDLSSGNEWRLRRIVGKFHCAATPEEIQSGQTELPTVDVAAAFIVLRTDDDGNPQRTGDFFLQEGPLAQDGAENPWIWRRRWLLTPLPEGVIWDQSATTLTQAAIDFTSFLGGNGRWPSNTAGYHSVADGPHIDQKTARRIKRAERLYFWVQARMQDNTDAVGASLNFQLDYRLLGSVRGATGNRRNASR